MNRRSFVSLAALPLVPLPDPKAPTWWPWRHQLAASMVRPVRCGGLDYQHHTCENHKHTSSMKARRDILEVYLATLVGRNKVLRAFQQPDRLKIDLLPALYRARNGDDGELRGWQARAMCRACMDEDLKLRGLVLKSLTGEEDPQGTRRFQYTCRFIAQWRDKIYC